MEIGYNGHLLTVKKIGPLPNNTRHVYGFPCYLFLDETPQRAQKEDPTARETTIKRPSSLNVICKFVCAKDAYPAFH